MSPTLLNISLEEIIKETLNGDRGVSMDGERIECISFADDILAENKVVLTEMLSKLEIKAKIME